ncbi:MAG: caspase family protein [Pseudomonadota bacterium]
MPRLIKVICLLLGTVAAAPAAAEDRLALVIGNAGYRNIPALANPVNDAELMARTLRDAGFEVTVVLEANRDTMRRAVEGFGQNLQSARPGALALFYFAGHGVRSDGFNYLLPLGVEIRSEADIATEAVAAEWVLEEIEVPGITNVMVLDACRNNPFDHGGPGRLPELGDGLAKMTARNGNLVAYATGPGDVALDGTGANSPYTAALARAIETSRLDVEGLFARVRNEVETETAGAQIPWESSSLETAVFLQPAPAPAAAEAPQLQGEGALVELAITFRPGRWGGGALGGCTTLYRFAPVRLPVDGGGVRRLGAINGEDSLALELSVTRGADGIELRIVPVSNEESGRPVTTRLADLSAGPEHALYTHSRHPDLFGCGAMTVYLTHGG